MNYKLEGTPNSPVLIFSNSLGSETMMWDEFIPHLLPYFRVLRYDTRGHGNNQNDDIQHQFSIADLGQDVVDLMDKLDIGKAYFCGLSMGGLIGQWLGINHPNRFKKFVLINTAAKIGNSETWNTRIKNINEQGLESIIEGTLERWFTAKFRAENPQKVAQTKAMFLRSNLAGYSACCAAIRDADFTENSKNLNLETLVITGDEDPVTNVEQAEFLVKNIPNAQIKILHARHLSATELPKDFAHILIDFFVGNETSAKGMHVRRTVLGDAHVDKANAKINSLNVDFQEFITKYAWGETWTRPNLSKHNRSLITLSMLIALNRPAEFKMHIKAAINNGVSVDEIKEVIMQSAIYCGLPAANDALHLTEEVLNDLGIAI